jgi:Ca-activated chloride channel family protein
MTFRSPGMLAALVLIPILVAAYVSSRRRRTLRAAALAAQGLVTTNVGRRQKLRRHVPFALFAAALAVLIVATARPMATVKVPRREATVVLAVDVSNSMAATDIKPSRIDAAKAAAVALVRQQPSAVRIGVVAFGPGAVIVQTPTLTHADALAAIDRLTTGGGTSLGTGLLTSLDAIAGKTLTINQAALSSDSGQVNVGYYGASTIVLLSDGEETGGPDPVALAGVASVAGVHVHTIGIGTTAGTTVQINGFSVATALDSDLLKKVASVTNGSYHQAPDEAGLTAVSKTIDLRFKIVTEHTEITGILTAAAAMLLVAGALLSVLWFGRVV